MLELDADLLTEGEAAGLALVKDLTAVREDDVFNDLERCGLARAVGAEQAEADALADGERDPIYGRLPLEFFMERNDFKDRFHGFFYTTKRKPGQK